MSRRRQKVCGMRSGEFPLGQVRRAEMLHPDPGAEFDEQSRYEKRDQNDDGVSRSALKCAPAAGWRDKMGLFSGRGHFGTGTFREA